MSLYRDLFANPDKALYYNNGALRSSLLRLKEEPNEDNSRAFIEKYFEAGNKEKVFMLDFKEKYLEKGKHLHTAALCLLGCYLSDLIDNNLKEYFSKLIGEINDWYDFKYTWFLTALYHDAGCAIENDNLEFGSCEYFKSLEFHFGKQDIKYNVYRYMETYYLDLISMNIGDRFNIKMQDYFTFPEPLISNYFFYRANKMNAIDHGILAGYIMFDRLIKNYKEAWLKANVQDRELRYRGFTYNNLNWKIEHQAHFAAIANSIISHNIWYGTKADEEWYRMYGLDIICSSKATKINIAKWPLVFFLDLIDTIEPVKRFTKLDPRSIWKNIDIKLVNNSIEISNIGEALKDDSEEYNKWLNGIYSLTDWLDITIYPEHKEQVIESIKLIPILEAVQ